MHVLISGTMVRVVD